MLTPGELARYLETALRLADEAGAVARKYFRSSQRWSLGPDRAPVSTADRAIDRRWRDVLARRHPDHAILGSHDEASALPSGTFTWVLTPIGGPRAFISGRATFAHMISLTVEGRPVIGVIDQPILQERWVGAGTETTFNGQTQRCRSEPGDLGMMRWCTTNPMLFTDRKNGLLNRLLTEFPIGLYGGDGYSYGLLVSGHLDLVVDVGLTATAFCPLVPVVEGARGGISDWQGQPLTLQSTGDILATCDQDLHQRLIDHYFRAAA